MLANARFFVMAFLHRINDRDLPSIILAPRGHSDRCVMKSGWLIQIVAARPVRATGPIVNPREPCANKFGIGWIDWEQNLDRLYATKPKTLTYYLQVVSPQLARLTMVLYDVTALTRWASRFCGFYRDFNI